MEHNTTHRIEEIDRMYKKFEDYTNKDIKDLTKSELDDFVKSIIEGKTHTTIRFYIIVINKILAEVDNGIRLSIDDYTIKQEVKYIDKKALYELVEYLDSYQDAFILMAIYNGIAGKQMEDLRNLKTSYIDFKNNVINIPYETVINKDGVEEVVKEVKTYKMDEEFAEVADMAIHQLYGCALSENGVYGANGEFTYNPKCEYVLKVRPYKSNGQGTDPITYNGFRTRVRNILRYLNLDMTINELEKSGYLYRLKQKSDTWTYSDMKYFLKEMHIPCEIYNMLRLFENTFNK